jgi:hypothetical protein
MSPAIAEPDFRLEERSSPWRDAWRRFDRKLLSRRQCIVAALRIIQAPAFDNPQT